MSGRPAGSHSPPCVSGIACLKQLFLSLDFTANKKVTLLLPPDPDPRELVASRMLGSEALGIWAKTVILERGPQGRGLHILNPHVGGFIK